MFLTAELNETGYQWLLAKVAKYGLTINAERTVRDNRAVFAVEISGQAPVIPGHTFVGVVDHVSEDGNILKAAPGQELPPEFRHAPPLCQHCGLVRRRHSTFVLQNATGHVQVGRNCLAEYVRDPDVAESLIAWAGAIDEIRAGLNRPENTCGGSGEFLYSVDQLVRLSIAHSAQFGWVSAQRAQETDAEPTAWLIRDFARGRRLEGDKADRMRTVAELSESEHVREQARHVADYVSGVLGAKPDDQVTNYESNLVVLFRQDYVPARYVALVCSAHRAHYRYAAEIERRSQVVGEHVGNPGERGEFEVEIREIRSLGVGDYGERFLVRMFDRAGNQLVWFTGESCSLEENRGEYVWVKATVTEHGEYADKKQTQVNRVKVIPGPTPPKKPRKPRKAS